MEHLVQFDNKRGTSPGLDIPRISPKGGSAARNAETGAAWSSSARALRCSVKSVNERNPCSMLFFHRGLPVPNRRKVGMTSDQHGPYVLGDTGATMAGTMGSNVVRRSKSLNPVSVRIEVCNSTS